MPGELDSLASAPALDLWEGSSAQDPADTGLFRGLRRCTGALTIELARRAASLVSTEGWIEVGYLTLVDFSREEFDRSGRWLQDLAFLGEALDRLPALSPALLGEGDAEPLGRIAALHLARVASSETFDEWLALARKRSIRDLRSAVRRALASRSDRPSFDASDEPGGTTMPDVSGQPETTDLRASDLLVRDEEETELEIQLPREAAAAFEEGLELHRAVSGKTCGPASFLEALVGETAARLPVPEEEEFVPEGLTSRTLDNWKLVLPKPEGPAVELPEIPPTGEPIDRPLPEDENGDEARQVAGEHCFHLIARLEPAAIAWARDLLARVSNLTRCRPFEEDAASLTAHVKTCLHLEGELERCLANLLALSPMPGRGRAKTERLAALGEELFGVSRRTIERRMALKRVLGWHPEARAAYEDGRIGQGAAWLVARVLGTGPASERTLERAWVEQAKKVTVRRLQDDVRIVDLRRHDILAFEGDDYRTPVTDTEWLSLLPCVPGATLRRVEALAEKAHRSRTANVFLRVRVSEDQAQSFIGALKAACRDAEGAGTGEKAQPGVPGTRNQAWVGLLSMILDYVRTWDDPRHCATQRQWRLFARDRYRCMAPGCTVRRGLELHHIEFRSQGGDDEATNLITLCRGHHRLGVHGGLLKVVGKAPFDLYWRLGREGSGTWYRADRRLEG